MDTALNVPQAYRRFFSFSPGSTYFPILGNYGSTDLHRSYDFSISCYQSTWSLNSSAQFS
ncbi:unnamed protein product, partial [Nesidiocoris tenuis]